MKCPRWKKVVEQVGRDSGKLEERRWDGEAILPEVYDGGAVLRGGGDGLVLGEYLYERAVPAQHRGANREQKSFFCQNSNQIQTTKSKSVV